MSCRKVGVWSRWQQVVALAAHCMPLCPPQDIVGEVLVSLKCLPISQRIEVGLLKAKTTPPRSTAGKSKGFISPVGWACCSSLFCCLLPLSHPLRGAWGCWRSRSLSCPSHPSLGRKVLLNQSPRPITLMKHPATSFGQCLSSSSLHHKT